MNLWCVYKYSSGFLSVYIYILRERERENCISEWMKNSAWKKPTHIKNIIFIVNITTRGRERER